MTSGIKKCAQCNLPPLRWRDGNGYCCTHAVEIGVPDTDEAYGIKIDKPRRVNTSAYTVTAKMNASERLNEYMARVKSDLQARGKWEEEAAPYVPDLFSESRVEHKEIPGLDLPYRSLNNEPRDLPF